MKLLNLWVGLLVCLYASTPAKAGEKPTYQELEQRIAELEASKARTSEIANTALVELQREMLKNEQLEQDIELSNRLVGKLNELVHQQNRALNASNDLTRLLESKVNALLEIATSFEKELLIAKGQNQAYEAFVLELRQGAEQNQKILDRWSSILTAKQLPLRESLRNDFLTMRWRFKTFNEKLFKDLDLLDISIAPDEHFHQEPSEDERPKTPPGKITS